MYNKILKNKNLFVPWIFTEKQFLVIEKYVNKSKLSNAEKKSLYTSIKRKLSALESIDRRDNEYYITGGKEIIKSRLDEAKKIISEYNNAKMFVSGSFLFSKEYGDIDIYIITKRGYKEKFEGKRHIIYLSEKKLSNPIINSAALISVSNFFIPSSITTKKPKLNEMMSTYHEAVISHMQKDAKNEAKRRLIFDYNLFCKNKTLNGKELKESAKSINLKELDVMIQELCKKLFKKTYLYVAVHDYIKTLEDSIKNIQPNEHLLRYKDTYEELIYGKQRSKAEVN